MPRWWRRKKGREGRAHAPGHARQPLPPSGRRRGRAARDPAGARKRERAPLPAAAPGRARAGRDPAAGAVGRPRLCLARARAGARPAPDPLLHQPAAHAGGADSGRPAHARGLARQETAPEDTRSAGSPPLARRAHQRLAESAAPDRHPPRPQTRELPRLSRARHDRHPHPIIFRHAPDPGQVPKGHPTTLQDPAAGRPRVFVRAVGTAAAIRKTTPVRTLFSNAYVVAMDDAGTELENGWILAEDGFVVEVGDGPPPFAEHFENLG